MTAPKGDESLETLVRERRIIVCCGSGGVGKTTTAAVIALQAAEAGRKAVVVTIDPAKRLADALGLDGLTNEPSRIDGDFPGELSAMMLDTKSTFDALVGDHASDDEQRRRILDNSFYRNISGALSGTQEYMAMEKLYELHDGRNSGKHDFDLIVIDTPPTRNTLDFLDAPRRLTKFLDHRLYKLMTVPNRGVLKAVNMAAQSFVRSIAKVVGADVIDDAIAFFQAFDGMEQGFKDRAEQVEQLLRADDTAFVLVASPRRDTMDEATFFAEKLAEGGIPVRSLVINRMHPNFADGLAEATRERANSLDGTAIGDLYRNLADFQLVSSREEEHIAPLAATVAPAPVVRVPFLRSDVHDLAGLREIERYLR
ncbi:ArsA family ATPase [Actinospongicola halichondriae]|uniref:ArsA family ATPase n=1 Tax=Actinospongicola halichondriae TaxID=3236844 RepID=UPI003D445F33